MQQIPSALNRQSFNDPSREPVNSVWPSTHWTLKIASWWDSSLEVTLKRSKLGRLYISSAGGSANATANSVPNGLTARLRIPWHFARGRRWVVGVRGSSILRASSALLLSTCRTAVVRWPWVHGISVYVPCMTLSFRSYIEKCQWMRPLA